MKQEESPELKLLSLLQRLLRRLWQISLPAFKPRLTYTELSILMLVYKAKAARAIELARMLGIPPSTLTGILDRLEAQKLIKRSPSPHDRRCLIISATPRLAEFKHKLFNPLKIIISRALACLPANRLNMINHELEELLSNLEDFSIKSSDEEQKSNEN